MIVINTDQVSISAFDMGRLAQKVKDAPDAQLTQLWRIALDMLKVVDGEMTRRRDEVEVHDLTPQQRRRQLRLVSS